MGIKMCVWQKKVELKKHMCEAALSGMAALKKTQFLLETIVAHPLGVITELQGNYTVCTFHRAKNVPVQ